MSFSTISKNPSDQGGGSGGGSGTATTSTTLSPVTTTYQSITQSGHGFQVGDSVLYTQANGWQKAIANSITSAQSLGVVCKVNSSSSFFIAYNGLLAGLTGLSSGNLYYLSPITAGEYTPTRPNISGHYIKPVFYSVTSTNAIVLDQTAIQVGSDSVTATTPSQLLPVGQMMPFAGSSLPTDWLWCDGQAVDKTTYSALFTAIGNQFYAQGTVTSVSSGSNFPLTVTMTGGRRSLAISQIVSIQSSAGWNTNATITGLTTSGIILSAGTGITFALNDQVTIHLGASSDSFFLPDMRGKFALGAGRGDGLSSRTLGDIAGEQDHVLTTGQIPSHSHITVTTGGSAFLATGTRQFQYAGITGSTESAGSGNSHNNMPPHLVTNWIIRSKQLSDYLFVGATGSVANHYYEWITFAGSSVGMTQAGFDDSSPVAGITFAFDSGITSADQNRIRVYYRGLKLPRFDSGASMGAWSPVWGATAGESPITGIYVRYTDDMQAFDSALGSGYQDLGISGEVSVLQAQRFVIQQG